MAPFPLVLACQSPNQRVSRGAEGGLVSPKRETRLVIGSCRFRPGKEIDVDATDPVAAELDVPGPRAAVEALFALAPDLPHDRQRDCLGRAFGEHAGLRRAGVGDVADRLDVREPGL
jgi:hypothetical protein